MRLVKFTHIAAGIIVCGMVSLALCGTALAAETSREATQVSSLLSVHVDNSLSIKDSSVSATLGDFTESESSSVEPVLTADPAVLEESSELKASEVNVISNASAPRVPSAQESPANEAIFQSEGETLAGVPGIEGKVAPIDIKLIKASIVDETMVESAISVLAESTVGATISAPLVKETVLLIADQSGDRSAVLSIQPLITSRVVLAEDLATAIPSDPISSRDSVPAKSDGALGRLAASLMGIVVPPSFSSTMLVIAWTTIMASLALGLRGLLPLVSASYGFWLRRSGFATAARSDLSVRKVTFFFATPLLLGHGSSLCASGPIFCGGKQQI